MLAIKLQRIGKKHQPSYRLVVAEKRSKLSGQPVEDLGSYNPFSKKTTFKKERILYWLGAGAKPTATSHNLLVKKGIINAPKIKIAIKKKAQKEETPAAKETTKQPGGEIVVPPAEGITP